MTSLPLAGKVALVTGSSRGIGRGIALELARRGADVAVHCVRGARAASDVADEVRALGRRALTLRADLADGEAIARMCERIGETFGRCDVFVANAASGVQRPVLDVREAHWDWTVDVNVRSVLRCARHVVPLMRRQGWGRIVTVSSLGSRRVYPSYAMVGISKAALEALTRYLAVELVPDGIVVNAVAPGVVDTAALRHFPIGPADIVAGAGERTPARRLTTPEDVGRLIGFLCSDDAAMIVGQTIVVDGGLSLLA